MKCLCCNENYRKGQMKLCHGCHCFYCPECIDDHSPCYKKKTCHEEDKVEEEKEKD